MAYSIFPRNCETHGGRGFSQLWGTQRSGSSRFGMSGRRAMRSRMGHKVTLTWDDVPKSHLEDVWDLVETSLGGSGLVVCPTFQSEAVLTASYADTAAYVYVDDVTPFAAYSITIDSTNNKLDFQNDTGVGELTATITSGTYSAYDLAVEINTQMDAASATNYSVDYLHEIDRFSITETADANATGYLDLLWFSGTNTAAAIGGVCGFDVSRDRTGATEYYSEYFKSTYGSRIMISKKSDGYETSNVTAITAIDTPTKKLTVLATNDGETYGIGSLVEPVFNANIILPDSEHGDEFMFRSRIGAGLIVSAEMTLIETFCA